ncbi:metallophosphoesterase [Candidatus Woesearchaeota archaeon]|nr:metallophosphoesterase [Candidatus Woesearchaeota archaeon]
MRILPNIEIVDLALYFNSTLVIADVHIGYEEALNKQGILVPRLQFKEIVKRMNGIFAILRDKKIERIVVNGDLKHEFGTISEQEWRNALKFIDLLSKDCNEIVLIKGNHDTILGPIARKRNVKCVDYLVVDSILITHGNKIPDKTALKGIKNIIIGHEHPAVSLREGPRVEQFKCFLKGKYKGRNLIVQPSFNTMVEGTDILRDKILSPFLKQNLDNFEVYVVEDKVYGFGKLKGLRKR